MTVKELIKELQQYPSKMEVVRIVDFENPDENGNLKVEPIDQVFTQTYYDDQFGDDNDVTVVMI